MSTTRQKIAELTYAKGVEDALSYFLGSEKVAQGPQMPMDPQGQPQQGQPQPSAEELEMQAKQMRLDSDNVMMQARQIKSQQQEAEQQTQFMQQGVPPIEAQQAAAAQPNLADMQAQQEQLQQLRAQQQPQQQPQQQQPQQVMGAQPVQGTPPAPEQIEGPQPGQDINDPGVMQKVEAAYQYLLDQGVPEPRAIAYIRSLIGGQ